jgi:hypothetical protein
LPTLSLAAAPAPDAAVAVPGQAIVAVPGFAAMLAAAQPAEVVAAPVAVPQPADSALPAAAAAPRFSAAMVWQVIDGDAPLRPRPAALGPLPAPDISNELPRQGPETSPGDPTEADETPVTNVQNPLAVLPVVVEKPPETPAVAAKGGVVAAKGGVPTHDAAGVMPRRRGLVPVAASPIAPVVRGPQLAAARPAAAAMPGTTVARPLDLPLPPLRSAEATAPTRQPETAVGALAPQASAPVAVPPTPAATPAAPNPAAEASVAAIPAPRPRATPEIEWRERRDADPPGLARLVAVAPVPTVAGVAVAPAIPAPQPQTGPEPSGPAAAAPPAPANAPAPAAPVVTDRFGDVRIGLEGDARDLKVSLAVTAGTPALLAAEAPRLAADLAANGIRLQSLDVGSFAGGTASGGQSQRQGGHGPAGPQAAFLAPVPPARAAAADRYA